MESWYENGNKYSETIQNPNAKEDEILKNKTLGRKMENGVMVYTGEKMEKISSIKIL